MKAGHRVGQPDAVGAQIEGVAAAVQLAGRDGQDHRLATPGVVIGMEVLPWRRRVQRHAPSRKRRSRAKRPTAITPHAIKIGPMSGTATYKKHVRK